MNPLDLSRFVHMYDDAAIRKGIKLSIGFDFDEYISITEAVPTKGRTYPTFRPDRSPIKLGEGYWVVGVDKNKEVAHVQAARLYDLSHSNLAEHLQSLKLFYANPAKHAHPNDRCVCRAPSAQKIAGRVVYHGDLWVRKDFRGQGMAKIMSRISIGASVAMWDPDFTCGLAGQWSVDKGVYDAPHREPGGSILRLVAEDIEEEEWLFWRTAEELKTLIARQDGSGLAVPS
ncbi:hypothetical protein IVB36_06310 [Bradyrhizobium sp. 35]|uniref:hypothetical protein n=1 Tax=Bradyrhizobium sp. 35 TaxID=2782670 RepID=UPI001FF79DD6|nr:hypothetical protein [Bradyrhizobium sp. 35]MCK1450514.1 hypothetical protein [Bradyrhizobium sp. 35]